MASKKWILIDVASDVWIDELRLGPADVRPTVGGGPAGDFSIRKRTLRGGLRDGLNIVEVDNGRLRFTLLCDRGMGIWRAWCDQLELGWPSPVAGPVHPKFVPLDEASGIAMARMPHSNIKIPQTTDQPLAFLTTPGVVSKFITRPSLVYRDEVRRKT